MLSITCISHPHPHLHLTPPHAVFHSIVYVLSVLYRKSKLISTEGYVYIKSIYYFTSNISLWNFIVKRSEFRTPGSSFEKGPSRYNYRNERFIPNSWRSTKMYKRKDWKIGKRKKKTKPSNCSFSGYSGSRVDVCNQLMPEKEELSDHSSYSYSGIAQKNAP